jgi:hypothetical protein
MITFDWTQITWIGNPLVVPWWAEVNYMIGFVLFVTIGSVADIDRKIRGIPDLTSIST